MTIKHGRKPSEPQPWFRWEDDGCAGIKCGCDEEFMVSVNHPTRCPKCQRIFQYHQITWIEERNPDSVNICPWCGGVRYDDGTFCPECNRNGDGETLGEVYAKIRMLIASSKEQTT